MAEKKKKLSLKYVFNLSQNVNDELFITVNRNS